MEVSPQMDRVGGAGLSGAKEATGFRAVIRQPRPPIKSLLTEQQFEVGEVDDFGEIGLRAERYATL